jgi:hypothetical protein
MRSCFRFLLKLSCLLPMAGACPLSNVKVVHDSGETPPGDTTEDSPDDSGDDSPTETAESGDSHPGDTAVEEVPGAIRARPCAPLYDPDELQTFLLEIDEAEWGALRGDCRAGRQAYHPARFTWRDETVDAQVRLKGNWSWSCQKLQFIISFNEADPDARFHGLRKLVLDAPWYDASMLHERLAFFFLERHGAPASCVNHARLDINGEYYGLYANVERIDREYLERHFEDPSGYLYQAGRELKTHEDEPDIDTSRIDAFWAARSVEALEEVVDMEAAILAWSGEAMLPDPDSYWAGVEINFYLYDDPKRGIVFLPYDADISFGENIWPGLESADPILWQHTGWLREEQYRVALSDPGWCEAYVARVAEAREAYDVALLQSKVDAWSEQIAAAAEEDPHRTWTLTEHRRSLTDLRSFLERRAAYVDTWLAEGGHCPPAW